MWNKTANKYGARKVTRGGKTYHSALEADDALWLQTLERDGELSELKEQVRFRIIVNGQHVVDSIVDFQFVYNGKTIWYETKGFPTPEYRIKRKLIEILIPSNEVYLVNAKALMDYMRGRTRNRL